jgi:hypothetical protein
MCIFYHLSPLSSLILRVANIISLIIHLRVSKSDTSLLSYLAAGTPFYELSLMEYGICNFTLLLNFLLILFENVQHWCHENLLLMVRLMVLEATSFLPTVVLLSRPQRLAQSSCHYQTLSCYLFQYMSHMLALEILTADSFLSGWNGVYCSAFF